MIARLAFLPATLVAGFLLAPAEAGASLLGRSFAPTYQYPTLGTVYPDSTWNTASFAVGVGEEAQALIEGITTIHVDFSEDRLTLRLETVHPNPTWNTIAFNGPVFSVTGAALQIASATVLTAETTLAGFDDSRVTVTQDEIRVNWNGLSYADGTTIGIAFAFEGPAGSPIAVPEPMSLALFGAGLLGLTGVARLRRR